MIDRERYDRDMGKWHRKLEKLMSGYFTPEDHAKLLDEMPHLTDYRKPDPAPPGTHDMMDVR